MSRPTASAVFLGLGLLIASAVARAGENDSVPGGISEQQLAFFEQHVRPLLIEHCYECHSAEAEKLQGGLALDSKPGWMAGGDSGPAIVPGKPDESPLLEALRYESYEMPPRGKLPDEEIAKVEKWIAMGAHDPRVEAPTNTPTAQKQPAIDWDQARMFWSFQPPRRHELPKVADATWPRDSIDCFVLAKIEAAGLEPAAEADRATLLRRATYDLIGLPPTPGEIDAFCADTAPGAFDRVVDRLLSSPHFGERWGRHWLDIARYAESTGGGRSLLYGAAWRYRDYVIDAFNNDKPFDRFIVEQLAGDLLPYDDYRQGRDQLVATGFLALGPSNYELQDKEQLRADVIDEQVDTTGRAFLGMTLGCARCHDHKFDPVPTTDYYALAGIFRSTRSVIDANVSSWVKSPLPLPPQQQQMVDEYAATIASLEQRAKQLAREHEELTAQLSILTLDDGDAALTGTWKTSNSVKPFVGESYRYASGNGSEAVYEFMVPEAGQYDIRVTYTPHENRSSKTQYSVSHVDGITTVHVDQTTPPSHGSNHPSPYTSLGRFTFKPEEPATVLVSTVGGPGTVVADAVQLIHIDAQDDKMAMLDATEQEMVELDSRRKKLAKSAPPPAPEAVTVEEHEECGDYQVCIRGDIRNLGDTVPRGFLTVATSGSTPQIAEGSSGRLELAHWIASAENPLTARVAANRVWQHLFGQGLVRTVDNFGVMGEQPSHPQLLDYLAIRLVDHGWCFKSLIREIMLSRTYQLASKSTAEAMQADPDNRLLSHQNRRRLDAEAIRDSMLSLSGELDLMPGGNTVRDGTKKEYGYSFDETRRSVYLPVFRNQLHDLFAVFDFPDPNLSIGRRNVSTLATQSLFLLNSSFAIDRSQLAAQRLLGENDLSDEARLVRLYRMALGRSPSVEEQQLGLEFLGPVLDASAAEREGEFSARRLEHWAALCQTVMACVDYRYLD